MVVLASQPDRFSLALSALLAFGVGCGDGVGRPLVAVSEGPNGAAAVAGSMAGATAGGGAGGMDWGLGGSFTGVGARSGFAGAPIEEGTGGRGRPPNQDCGDGSEWSPSTQAAEELVLSVINVVRTAPEASEFCAPPSSGARLPPFRPEPQLVCSARRHSHEMADEDFLSTVNPTTGEGPAERIARTGYSFGIARELIAQTEPMSAETTPLEVSEQVLEKILAEAESCEVLLDPGLDAAGVGYYQGLWTVDLAGP